MVRRDALRGPAGGAARILTMAGEAEEAEVARERLDDAVER